MISHTFTFLKAAVKQVACVLICSLLCLGLMQTAAQAVPAIIPEQAPTTSSTKLEEMKAQRREAQSRASQAANTEEKASSLDEVFSEKLNFDEVREENVLTNDTSENIKVAPSPKSSR